MALAFGVLGSVEARIDGALVDIGPARQRCVLAALVASPNQVLPADQLVDRVWGERVPTGAKATLRTYLSRLRHALSGNMELARRAGGYVLTVDPVAVDLFQFHDLLTRARAASDDEALALLDDAVGLWRGEAFAGLDTPWVNALRETLEAERIAAELDQVDLKLRRGQHDGLLASLTGRMASRPLDERLAGQLMLALYRSGRQAEALAQYEQIRRRLAEELGADPAPALQQLHHQILTADRTLDAPMRSADPIPRQLPLAPATFTGRHDELTRLSDMDGTVVISAIAGAGGVGKTWLALHWAHSNVDRFPDGQLFVDLHGFGPGEAVPAEVALRGFLAALDVDPAHVPADLPAAAARYRSRVAGKHMLIMLDNARDAAQVIPLLPGSSTCTVLVTSRDRMASLVTSHGAHPVALDVLSEPDAQALLVRRLSATRIEAEPAAVAELLTYCAGLPLALGIVAGRVALYPDFPLQTWTSELRDADTRLAALGDGDLSSVLSWSYKALSTELAELLTLLALAPGPDIGIGAAASLAGRSPTETRSLLRRLQQMSLVDEHVPGRWRMHDLIRLHARGYENNSEPALRRLIDHYIHTAAAADRLLAPHRSPIELDKPAPGTHPDTPTDAPQWFTTEHTCLLAALWLAADRGWHRAVWQLAWALDTVHSRRGYLSDRLAAWELVHSIAAELDPNARILAYRSLGRSYACLDRHQEALAYLHRAFTLAEEAGDLSNQAHTHRALAWAWGQHGDNELALEHAAQALEVVRTQGNPLRKIRALNTVGWYATLVGRHELARTQCSEALTLARELDDRTGEADALDGLGHLAHHTGTCAEAIDYYEQAIALYRETGDTSHEADCLTRLGHSHTAAGHHTAAQHSWHQALHLYQTQHRTHEAHQILNLLAQRNATTHTIG